MGRISVTFFVSCSVCIGAKQLREMRVQRASSMHIHELHSSTDAQARNMALIQPIQKVRFQRIANGLNRSTNNRILGLTISGWVDVGASCQQNAICTPKTRNKLNGIYV